MKTFIICIILSLAVIHVNAAKSTSKKHKSKPILEVIPGGPDKNDFQQTLLKIFNEFLHSRRLKHGNKKVSGVLKDSVDATTTEQSSSSTTTDSSSTTTTDPSSTSTTDLPSTSTSTETTTNSITTEPSAQSTGMQVNSKNWRAHLTALVRFFNGKSDESAFMTTTTDSSTSSTTESSSTTTTDSSSTTTTDTSTTDDSSTTTTDNPVDGFEAFYVW